MAGGAIPMRRRAFACVAMVLALLAANAGEPAVSEAPQARRAAVLAAATRGCGSVPELEAALEDASATVRRTAVSALARLECATAHAALRRAVAHDDAEVRRLAMAGLGSDWLLRHRLAEALCDSDPVTRDWIARRVGEAPLDYEHGFELHVAFRLDTLPAPNHNAWIVQKWESADDARSFLLFYRAPHLRFSVSGDGLAADSVRSRAIEAGVSYQVSAVFDPDRGELRLMVSDGEHERTWSEPTDIRRLHASHHPVVIGGDALGGEVSRVRLVPANAGRYIAGDNTRQRREAALGLVDRGATGVAALDALLADPSPLLRRTAAHALARVGTPLAFTALEESLAHGDARVRQIAMQGLGSDWLLRYRLAEALSDPDPVTRNWVRVHLGERPPGDEFLWARAGEQLAQAFGHESAPVRYEAVKLCGHWEEAPDRFGEMIEALAADGEALVREAAQRVMWPFDRPLRSSRERFSGVPLTRVGEQPLPREGWRFRTEAEGRAGHLQAWYSPGFDDGDWNEIAIEQAWGQAGYEGYIGVGWYRRAFEAPAGEFDAAELHFGAADESAWVWLNGEYVSQHDIGAAGWDTPFTMDVTDLIRWGQPNHITVRVHNTMGAGGLHRPVVLRLYRRR